MYETAASSWGNGSVVVDADGSAMSNEQIAAELNRLTRERNAFLNICTALITTYDAARRGDYLGNHTAYYTRVAEQYATIRGLVAETNGEAGPNA